MTTDLFRRWSIVLTLLALLVPSGVVLAQSPSCTGVIGDFVWRDANQNGVQDLGEPGILGVRRILTDINGNLVGEAVSNVNGYYSFQGLCGGTYVLNDDPETLPVEYARTIPNLGGDDARDSDLIPATVTLNSDTDGNLSVDSGFVPCGECKGGLTSLTLIYHGTARAFVEVVSETTVFADSVEPGGVLTVEGDDDKGKLKKDLKVFVDGEEAATIHTSCSKPIGPGTVFGLFEVAHSKSTEGGAACPLNANCQECKGGVVSLTLQFDGTTATLITVVSKDGDTLFNNVVEAGGSFSFTGPAGGKMGTEITVSADGVDTPIHTSCSKPIGPGSVFGAYTVLQSTSRDGGEICAVPVSDLGCSECSGGVTYLELQYGGSTTTNIRVVAKDGSVLFDESVIAGSSFSFTGTGDDNKMGTEITVTANGVDTSIHTSCSQPIGPGSVFGDFTVVESFSRDGGEICALGDIFCVKGVKPMIIVAKYTGERCLESDNEQNPKKAKCQGNPLFTSPVSVVASDKKKVSDKKAKVWFGGMVSLGNTFLIDATKEDQTKLKGKTHVYISDQFGLLQKLEIVTSCSEPLNVGDQFGSLVITDLIPEGGALPQLPPPGGPPTPQ